MDTSSSPFVTRTGMTQLPHRWSLARHSRNRLRRSRRPDVTPPPPSSTTLAARPWPHRRHRPPLFACSAAILDDSRWGATSSTPPPSVEHRRCEVAGVWTAGYPHRRLIFLFFSFCNSYIDYLVLLLTNRKDYWGLFIIFLTNR
jgi:hypothetical protein